MQLEIFTFCDAATEHAGKLNIIGTFDALRALETANRAPGMHHRRTAAVLANRGGGASRWFRRCDAKFRE